MTHVSVRRGLLYVSIAATAWGTGGAAGALLHRAGALGPVPVSFWRFAAGAVLLLLASRLLGLGRATDRGRTGPGRSAGLGRISLKRPAGLWRIVVTGVAMAVYQTAYFSSIAESGLAVATVITIGATPVFVAAGARLLLGERPGATGLGAVALALTGLAMLTLDGGSATFSVAGIGWALLSAAGYAGVTLLNRARPGEPYATAMGGFVVGGLCLLPVALAQGLLPQGDPLASWSAILYLGAVPTALAYGLFFTGLAAVRATTASVISLVEPVGAAAIGVLLLGERLTPQAVAGAVLLLAAVGLLALGERRGTVEPVASASGRAVVAEIPYGGAAGSETVTVGALTPISDEKPEAYRKAYQKGYDEAGRDCGKGEGFSYGQSADWDRKGWVDGYNAGHARFCEQDR
ncbi:DMT family transporter [Streptosporangium sp. NBC_01756]|uniref:DMT family transporter n=1 Tax=Streptosporangium sp. NBC_01756 TaxID=2975950 RepID=UPI002DD986DD|nr:EamA family transporter [Streptosporangium sp. NBC_01756]WSC88537.1 EamA family transporter [Streptosporangium sp. NBC_01756]